MREISQRAAKAKKQRRRYTHVSPHMDLNIHIIRTLAISRTHGRSTRIALHRRHAVARSAYREASTMFSLSATSSQVRIVTPRATTRRASSSRGAALVVRAEEKAAAAAPAPWTAPKLNPNTPSPIFGGSTGGLLRKAQVRSRAIARALQRFSFWIFTHMSNE